MSNFVGKFLKLENFSFVKRQFHEDKLGINRQVGMFKNPFKNEISYLDGIFHTILINPH